MEMAQILLHKRLLSLGETIYGNLWKDRKGKCHYFSRDLPFYLFGACYNHSELSMVVSSYYFSWTNLILTPEVTYPYPTEQPFAIWFGPPNVTSLIHNYSIAWRLAFASCVSDPIPPKKKTFPEGCVHNIRISSRDLTKRQRDQDWETLWCFFGPPPWTSDRKYHQSKHLYQPTTIYHIPIYVSRYMLHRTSLEKSTKKWWFNSIPKK